MERGGREFSRRRLIQGNFDLRINGGHAPVASTTRYRQSIHPRARTAYLVGRLLLSILPVVP